MLGGHLMNITILLAIAGTVNGTISLFLSIYNFWEGKRAKRRQKIEQEQEWKVPSQ